MAAIYLLISRVPKSAVNLPNKEWWFATPERKQVVYEKVRGMMASTGVFTNTVFLFTAYVVFQNAGIALPIRIPILEGVGCILLLTVVFLIFLAKNVSAFKRTN